MIQCPNCAVSLVRHKAFNVLQCHYCEFKRPAPEKCPQCSEGPLMDLGSGTETVEEEMIRRFPNARVLRMDRDTTTRKHAQRDILRTWKKGDADILIGTQMIAKGHHVPNVTLVGVVLSDVSLNLPDFRASERTFQLLLQVAGAGGQRGPAGPGHRPDLSPLSSVHPVRRDPGLSIVRRARIVVPGRSGLSSLSKTGAHQNFRSQGRSNRRSRPDAGTDRQRNLS